MKTARRNLLDLSVQLYGHYDEIADIVSYYGVLAIYALIQTAEADDDDELLDRCRRILQRYPHEIEHPLYNFPSYRIGGVARAYALYRGHMTDRRTRELVREYAEEMMEAPRDEQSLLTNPHHPEQNRAWVDVAMAATPYLLFAGLGLSVQAYVEEAARQAFLHYEVFRDPDNGLLHQCRNFPNAPHITPDHWGRGQAWGYLALTELVAHLPEDSPHRSQAEGYFRDLSGALLPHQSSRGLWRQEVPEPTAWEESSGTALILYGFGVGMRIGLLGEVQFADAFDKGIAGLLDHCIEPDGTTHLCCPGCCCPGRGERRGTVVAYIEDKSPVDDDPHGFGPLILALVEAARRER